MPARKLRPRRFDAIIVGAGVGGLYAIYRLRKLGLRVRAFEAGGGVGGTWYWNRYPACRCDVESMEYSYSFSDELQQEWHWPERYGTQPEILRYINHVADRFDLRRDIEFDTRVKEASFDSKTSTWTVKTDKGSTATARFCIMATGNLSTPRTPNYPGLERFKGQWYHTGLWPHEGVDFTGLQVGSLELARRASSRYPSSRSRRSIYTSFSEQLISACPREMRRWIARRSARTKRSTPSGAAPAFDTPPSGSPATRRR